MKRFFMEKPMVYVGRNSRTQYVIGQNMWVQAVGMVLLLLVGMAGSLFVFLVGYPLLVDFMASKFDNAQVTLSGTLWEYLLVLSFFAFALGSGLLYALSILGAMASFAGTLLALENLVGIVAYSVRSWWQWRSVCLDVVADKKYIAAQYNLGNAYSDQMHLSRKARRCWIKAAAHGHADARARLIAEHGSYNGVFDRLDTYVWELIAKAYNNEDSFVFNVSDVYLSKSKVRCAQKIAMRRLVDMEHRTAKGMLPVDPSSKSPAYTLGFAYWHGEGTVADKHVAVHWFHKAAEQGHPDAQKHLGFAYDDGEGVAKDEREAYIWYSIASAGGWLFSHHILHFVGERLLQSESEIVSAEKEAMKRLKEIDRSNAKPSQCEGE